MKRAFVFIAVFMLCIGFAGIAGAQEEQEDGQAESPAENACYTGGALEGKCDWPTDEEDKWAWTCGWYYARFISGQGVQPPDWCNFKFNVEAPFALCIQFSDFAYVLIEGAPNQPGNATLYNLGKRAEVPAPCDALEPLEVSVIWMQAPSEISEGDAFDACAAAEPSVKWSSAYILEDPALSGFNYICTDAVD